MIGSARRISVPTLHTKEIVLAGEKTVKKINQYRLAAKLGSGASSKVYLGIDDTTGAKYAVKRIKLRELCRTSTGIAQLEREIRLMRQFDHKNILKLIEVLHMSDCHEAFLVMEYAEKGCLGAFCEREQHLSHASIFSIMKQVASAIQYLHQNGFVHQDIKPWNILVDGTGRAILADFGIGHSFQSAAMVVGSPAFQAPEALDDSYCDDGDEEYQSSEEGPQKEDIWALGVTLYQLLFHKLPFVGDNLYEIVNFIKEKPLQIPDGVDERIASLVRSMLTVDPSKRIGVRTLLQNELLATAADLAVDMPETPKPVPLEGRLVQLTAKVCPPGHSFASVAMSIQRRLSFINAPYSPERLSPSLPRPTLTRTKSEPPEHESSSSGEEIEETGVGPQALCVPQVRVSKV